MTFWGSKFSVVFGLLLAGQGAFLLGVLFKPFTLNWFSTMIAQGFLVLGGYMFGVFMVFHLIRSGLLRYEKIKGR